MDESLKVWLQILGGTAGTGVVGWIVRTLVRRLSRDQVEVAKDRAEIDVIATLREELKNSRLNEAKAVLERNEAMIELGGMRREVELLREHIKMLNDQADNLRERIERMAQQGKV